MGNGFFMAYLCRSFPSIVILPPDVSGVDPNIIILNSGGFFKPSLINSSG